MVDENNIIELQCPRLQTALRPRCLVCHLMNNHIYSTLFKTQERESDRRSKEIEQRKESQNTHKQNNKDM